MPAVQPGRLHFTGMLEVVLGTCSMKKRGWIWGAGESRPRWARRRARSESRESTGWTEVESKIDSVFSVISTTSMLI